MQNLEALRVLLGCGYLRAGVLVLAGAMVEGWVERLVLGMVGLEAGASVGLGGSRWGSEGWDWVRAWVSRGG